MNKILAVCALLMITVSAFAQKDQGEFIDYENRFYKKISTDLDKYNNPAGEKHRSFKMSVKGKNLPKSHTEFTKIWCNDPLSQGNTGTCWCFSTSSFFESEIYRLTKKEIKLSELYTVYFEYVEKATEYVRTRGKSSFGEGSETNAVARMMSKYGVVPAAAFNGIKDGQPFHDHEAMYNEMYHYLKSLKRDGAWNIPAAQATIKSILDHYIGTPPSKFKYEGKDYTPKAFLNEVTGLKPNEYVNFMSLKQHPYYKKAVYDVPDNWWRSDNYNNVPLNNFMNVVKTAVKNGYSIALGGDVSEPGYLPMHDIAMVPDYDIPAEYINEDARQLRFTNGSTTDDHAIHIIGFKETKDEFWFLIKDSGSGARNGDNKGYYFYHENYIKLKMMSFTVHKDAAKEILKLMK